MPIPGFTAKETIPPAMKEWGAGDLHSGAGGKVVPKTPAGQKQALAIAYSMADQNKKKAGRKNKAHAGIRKGFHP